MACEPLGHNDDSIEVGYRLDGGSWVTAEIVGDASDVGGTIVVSTDSVTKTFRTMEVRIELNTAASTRSPRVKNVDVYARVNKHMKMWNLLLDCSDDAAPQGYNGAQIMDNIMAIPESTVVAFVDRYQEHDAENAGTEYDVVVDSSSILVSQEGEGIIRVQLLEVG